MKKGMPATYAEGAFRAQGRDSAWQVLRPPPEQVLVLTWAQLSWHSALCLC